VWLKDNFGSWLEAYLPSNRPIDKEENKDTTAKKDNSNESFLECCTTLSSLAASTKSIRLGAILVNLHRSPSITAKMISTLDVISNGRIEFGLSAGWYKTEIESYGLIYPQKAITRVQMLEESIKIIKKMLAEDEEYSSYKGRYYTISNAKCKPKPIQKPLPMWIGGGGKNSLQLAAKYCHGWIYGLCTYDIYKQKILLLNRYCNMVNRDHKDIVKAWHGVMLLIEGNEIKYGESIKNVIDNKLVNSRWMKNLDLVVAGTYESIIKEIEKYRDIGVSYFIIHFTDLPSLTSLKLFGKYVIPHFLHYINS
jgi:alkanesulfonate monooxygenase SsuD/methylene tetrahydromethanopterin reductase-like flavin-dependent oxidoreductase (luciferase family)